MFDTRIRITSVIATLAFVLASSGCANLIPSDQAATGDKAAAVYGQVILYHANPARVAELERTLNDPAFVADLKLDRAFINERILKPIDDYSLLYITYTKFSDPAASRKYLNKRLASVKGLVRRPPEHHIARLDAVYTAAGVNKSPNGLEFGGGRTGQNAHVALFVPQADYLDEYFKAVDRVKRMHVDRKPEGWIGDDLLSTETLASPSVIAPQSPRPRHATKLSLNYGEYESFRQNEIAYLNRRNSDDPDLIALQNVFYGTLQVPARYYLMQVLGNY